MKMGIEPLSKWKLFLLLGIDLALGLVVTRGRVIEIYGPESSGRLH
jgi:hypothetical protein